MRLSHVFLSIGFAMASLATKDAWSAARTANDTRPILAQFAGCISKQNPDLARAYVRGRPGTPLGDASFRKLFASGCLRNVGEFRLPPAIIKGAVAEALIQSQPGMPVNFDPATRARLDWSPDLDARIDSPGSKSTPESEKKRRDALIQEGTLGQIGECVVRAASSQTRDLFRTPINSAEEASALKPLTPLLSQCLPSGQTVAFDRTNLRSLLATAYYRLANAAPISGVAR